MKQLKRFKLWLLAAVLFAGNGVTWGQPWTYNFGTGTGTANNSNSGSGKTDFFTSTPTGGGTYRVRIGTAGGSLILANPGTTLGTDTEVQLNAATSTSTNKFGVYDWTSPSTVAYLKLKYRTSSSGNGNLNISLGINTVANDNQGYTSHYNNSLTSLTIAYTSGSISSVVRRISGSNTTITSSGFSKDADQVIEIYANNDAASKNYNRAGTTYTLTTKTWDLWVDGTRTVTGAATAGSLTAGTNISGFGFFAESSTSNAAWIYIDDLEYSNALPTGSVTAPTTQASNISFSNISQTGMTASWTNGDGAKRVVIMNTSNSFTDPTDGTDPAANTAYSGSGEQVVYNGNGNSLAVTGLTAGTTYWFRVYEYNGTGTSTKYLTTTATNNPNSQATSTAAPSISVTETTIPTMTAVANSTTDSETINISGTNLSNNITVTIDGTDAAMFSVTTNPSPLTSAGGTATITYTPTAAGTHTATLRLNSSGAAEVTRTLNGTATWPPLDPPVATAATNVTSTGFTANWNAVSGATEYEVSVFAKSQNYASDLVISEYVEGSSSNKYIEIFNGTGSSVDLSNYKLQLYANGASTPNNDITLTGTLNNGSTIVYKNSSAALTLPSGVAATNNTAVAFNGNDAVALYKISTSSYVDIFGRIGNDPGTAWTGDGGYTTLDKTLVRKANVTGGITVNPTGTGPTAFTTLTTEWDMYNTDVVSNLGSHTMNLINLTPISGSPFTVTSGTLLAVSGLNPGTQYVYSVKAKNTNVTSESSNQITTITNVSNNITASTLPDCATCNIVVENGGTLTVNANKTYNSVIVKAGGKLTLANGNTLNAPITIESNNDNGTGTYVDQNSGSSLPDITGTVNQYLISDRNWYLSSPVTAASVPAADNVWYYDETVVDNDPMASWKNATNPLVVGKGYIVNPTGLAVTVQFNGTLNTGNKSIGLTRTTEKTNYIGFNLVGNPYPSFLNAATFLSENSASVDNNIWYRTHTGTAYQFQTYNSISDVSVPKASNGSYIPPMQAFWVRAKTDGVTLDFTNAMRKHNDSTVVIRLRAPKAPVAERQYIRLQVNNATLNDELLLYSDANASNAYDKYDSPKMMNSSNSSAAINLYTTVGSENLVIDGRNTLPLDMVIPVTFTTNAYASGSYSISANELTNLPSGVTVRIIDNDVETSLSDGGTYTFTADAGTTKNFGLILRSPGAITGVENGKAENFSVYANNNGQLVIMAPVKSNYAIYNALGQLMENGAITSNSQTSNLKYTAGVYVVKVGNYHSTRVIVK
jgi:hypothetical protein